MTQKDTNVTLQDIATVVQIIDACSERGSFKGTELTVVGELREKFSAIVEANKPKDETPSEVVSEAEVGE